MTTNTIILDIECYTNFFYLGIKRKEDGKRVGFEFSPRADFDRDKVRRIMRQNRSVGFNSIPYDLPMLYLALDGASNADLKDASNRIINSRIPYWRVEEELGVVIPKNIDHIDIFETNPSVKRGLKALNGSMHHKRLQELPYHHAKLLTPDEMDQVIEYCQYGDIDGTEMLLDFMKEPIFLRESLRTRYNTGDLRSKSDAQVGEAILKAEVERTKGDRIKRAIIPDGTTFRYEPPEWMRFQTPYMQSVLDIIRNTDIEVWGGTVEFPKAIDGGVAAVQLAGLAHPGQRGLECPVAAVARHAQCLAAGAAAQPRGALRGQRCARYRPAAGAGRHARGSAAVPAPLLGLRAAGGAGCGPARGSAARRR